MVWTAFILGFAGSLHCMGMCSPLAMAVSKMSPNVVLNRLLYNGGRIFTYGLLGGVVASIGLAFPLMYYQNLLSILLGVALVVIGTAGITKLRIPFVDKIFGKGSLILKGLFSKYLKKKSYTSTFFLGSLNGFLPCGLSFLALTYCLALPGPLNGFNFMMIFGVGTLPAMLGFTSIFQWILNRSHFNSRRIMTILLVVSGVLLIVRVFFVHLPKTGPYSDTVVDIVICR